MRSCIYCGRTLEKDEVCQCPQAVKHREARKNSEQQASSAGSQAGDGANNTYHTGYTSDERTKEEKREKKKVKKEQAKRKKEDEKRRRSERFRAHADHAADSVRHSGSVISDLFAFMRRFSLTPVDGVSYPEDMSVPRYVILSAFNSIVLGFGVYFLRIGFAAGKRFTGILSVLLSPAVKLTAFLSGLLKCAAMVFLLLYVLWVILYLLDRIVMKSSMRFRDFLPRFACTTVPVTLIGAAGAVLGLFSIYSTVMLAGAAIVCFIVLTYEALRTQWSSKGPNAVLYIMTLAFFIFFAVAFNIWRIL